MTREELEQLARGERLDGEAYSRQVLARDLLAAQDELEKARTGIRQVADTVKVHAKNIERLQSDLQAIRGQIQPAHSSPYRILTEAEIAKLQALCDSREYLYWWDMGSALMTLRGLRLAHAAVENAPNFAQDNVDEPISDGDVSDLDGSLFNAFLDDEAILTSGVSKDPLCRPDAPHKRPEPVWPEPIWLAAPILGTTRFTGTGVRVSDDKPELGEAWAVAGPYTLGKVDDLLAKAPPAPPVSTVAMAGSTPPDDEHYEKCGHCLGKGWTGKGALSALIDATRVQVLEDIYATAIGRSVNGDPVWKRVLAIIHSLTASPPADSSKGS